MAVFHNKKLVFVHIPKTGGTFFQSSIIGFSRSNDFNYVNMFGYPGSINGPIAPSLMYEDLSLLPIDNTKVRAWSACSVFEDAFYDLFKHKNPVTQHLGYFELVKVFEKVYNLDISDYDSFSIIRDPIDRITSAMYRKIVKPEDSLEFLSKVERCLKSKDPEMYNRYAHFRTQKELSEGVSNLIDFKNFESETKHYLDILNEGKDPKELKIEKNSSKNRPEMAQKIDKYNRYREKILLRCGAKIGELYADDFLLYKSLKLI